MFQTTNQNWITGSCRLDPALADISDMVHFSANEFLGCRNYQLVDVQSSPFLNVNKIWSWGSIQLLQGSPLIIGLRNTMVILNPLFFFPIFLAMAC